MPKEFLNLRSSESPNNQKKRLEDEKVESRRSVLKKIAIGTGALGAATLTGEYLTRKEPASPEAPETFPASVEVNRDERVYTNGETVETEIGGVEVDGWKLNILEVDLAQTAFLQFDVVSGRMGGYSLLVKNKKGELIGWISRFAGSDEVISANHAARQNAGGFDVQSLYLVPDLDNSEIHLSLRQYESQNASLSDYLRNYHSGQPLPKKKDLPTKVHEYTVRLDAFSHAPDDAYDKRRVCSEIQLPPEQTRKAHRLHQIFSEFADPGFIYIQREGKIVKGEKTDIDTHDIEDPLYNRVMLTAKNFINPEFVDQAEHVVCHELTHGLVRNSKLSGKQAESWREMEQHYKRIFRATDKGDFRKFPAFTILQEAQYEKSLSGDESKKSNAGHPWDNANELIASAITVLRYFPDEFVENFKRLNPSEQQFAKETVRDSLEFLESMNKKPEALKRLVPKIEAVRSGLEL